MRIYIAGKLSSKENDDRNPTKVVTDYIQNIHAMCQAASRVRRKGHFPFIPALDFLVGVTVGDWEEAEYRDMGMAFLEVCDAVLVISRSWGVEQEVARADELDIPVYFNGEDIPDAERTD